MTARPHNLKPSLSLTTGHRPLTTVSRRGFTLTEVLIAMTLVAVLLVGLGRIFQITSDTIKTGQAYQTALRKQKAVYTAISKDFLGYASNGNIGESDNASGMLPVSRQAAIIIGSYRVSTTTNRAAADAIGNANAFSTSVANRSVAVRTRSDGSPISFYEYGDRNFRTDVVGFFGSGDFSRQTGTPRGGSVEFVSPSRSTEAYVWYGHLRVFAGDAAETENGVGYGSPGYIQTVRENNPAGAPGAGIQNRNNTYSEQFVLGRMAILLREPRVLGTSQSMIGDDGATQSFISRTWASPEVGVPSLGGFPNNETTPILMNSPLNAWSRVTYPLSTNTIAFGAGELQAFHARADVAATSAATFGKRLIELVRQQTSASDALTARDTWWWGMFTPYTKWPNSAWLEFEDLRPWANPYPTRPLTTENAAQRNNVLADGCSQFIVEFAGDFFTQEASGGSTFGDVTAVGPDGVTDFYVVQDGGTGPRRRGGIRWYGLPRDVDPENGNGIPGRNGNTMPPATSADVVPVRDWSPVALVGGRNGSSDERATPATSSPRLFSFEKVVPPPALSGNYINNNEPLPGNIGPFDQRNSYVCAWSPEEFVAPTPISGAFQPTTGQPQIGGGTVNGKDIPPVPQLIRVIVEMRDPAGALGTPVTQEYVFPVPQN